MIIKPPLKEDYPEFYHTYVGKVGTEDLITGLEDEMEATLSLIGPLSSEQVEYRYAEDKWNIKEVMIHVIDAERVFAYRSMRIGRGDTTPLPGFDQNDYGARVLGTTRSIDSILEEYQAVRLSSIKLFESFTEDDLNVVGTASDAPVTTRAIGYIILGHNLHHRLGIEENYL